MVHSTLTAAGHAAGSRSSLCRGLAAPTAARGLPLPALHRPQRPRLVACAYQSSQAASDALQQQQQESSASAASPSASHDEELRIEQEYDLDLNHYQPWWLKQPAIVAAGLGFLAVALVLDDEPTAKTFVLAAGPVALFWGIFLFLLPRQFKSFAVEYIETHPEVEQATADQEPAAFLELHDQMQEQQQQQQQQGQQQQGQQP